MLIMENIIGKVAETVQFLENHEIDKPEIGIILGTGLGGLVEEIEIDKIIDYAEVPNFPVSTVESHKGKLIYGLLKGKKVLAMQGRFHFYEGYSMQQITFPVRVMKFLGIKYLLVSNACGAVNLEFRKGQLMLITDHINLLGDNPLIGKNIDEFGTRFPDMSQPYSKHINEKIITLAARHNILLNKGVYAAVAGPNLETRAEYRYVRNIGADVIGMSTVPEVLVANHMRLPVAAISVITDECDPDNLAPVALAEMLEVASRAEKGLTKLFVELVGTL
jgi:purine-nucleoside phosphorylase